MDPEDDDEFELPEPPEPPTAPPREEIKIVDASSRRRSKTCVVCGKPKPSYVEIEIDGRVEFTCEDCYDLQSRGLSPEVDRFCAKCGGPLLRGDNFCGRCGTPVAVRCPNCGTQGEEEDTFCGKCGTRLGAPA